MPGTEKTIAPQEIKSRLSQDFPVLAMSVWNDEESKELAETLGAAVLLDKVDLATKLIPTIIQLSRETARQHSDSSF